MTSFKKKFRFRQDVLEYDLRLKKKFNWWWLLLLLVLLLPLLLLVPFKKEINVKVVDKAGEPIELAEVSMSYREYVFPNSSHVTRLTKITDSRGKASFGKLRFTLFSMLFHPKERVNLKAVKDDREGERSVRLHWFTKDPIVIVMDYSPFRLQVRSLGEDVPIPGASVSLELSDGRKLELTTDEEGMVSFEVEDIDDRIDVLNVSADGFIDLEEKRIPFSKGCGKVYVVYLYYRIDTLDIVLCIDGTGSMRSFTEAIKEGAMQMHESIQEHCRAHGKLVDSFRLRLVSFGDFDVDGDEALFMTDFFTLPGEESSMKRSLSKIPEPWGGDEPESGLEALSVALDSPWSPISEGRRSQLIVVWTDAPAHAIHTVGTDSKYYPSGVPEDLDGLKKKWETDATDPDGKIIRRMLLVAPAEDPWSEIKDNWKGILFKLFDSDDDSSYTNLDAMFESIAEAM